MNINQHFGNLVTKAAEEGADASQLITQRDRLFKDKVIPELVKRKANDAAIAQARLKFNRQTDTVMSNAGLLPKAGQSSRSFAKDKRADKANQEAVKTGSNFPIIKEAIVSTGETIGNVFSQGVGGMIEGAAGFVRDIGKNEKDSISAKTAKYGKDLRKGYENSASTFQKELQAGQHGKIPQLSAGAIQSVPAMALPFGAAKGVATAAIKVPMLAGAAPYLGLAAGKAAELTQNYGEVRRNATANLERDFPTWEKLQGNPLYQQNFNKLLDSGVNINQARQQARAETLDALSEGAANKYGTAMTALGFIAPSGAVLGSGILKNAPTSRIGKALVGGGVSADLIRREMTQAPRVGMAKLIPDISKTANIAAAKMVGKQALEEGLQGGIGEYGAQAASANIGGQAVDYKKVGQTILEEGLIGGIMGGGMQSALGGSPTSQAKEVANQLRNQTNALRQEEAAARKELADATQFNDAEKIQSAQINLQNIGAEANKVKAAYGQYGIETPHFVERFASQYQPQQEPEQQGVDPTAPPTPEAAPQAEPVQPTPAAQPAPVQPTQINKGMASTTNLVMDSVTKGLISPEEAQAIQTDPILGQVFSLVLSGDQAAAHNIVMNAVSLGNIDMNQAQNLIESIPRYAQLGQPQKPSLSGIVNDHVKQQIQPQAPSQDGGLFSNAVDLDPNTLEPIDQNQPSPFQDDFNEPKQFMNPTRASDYVRENGLADSHELVRHDDGVIEVRPRQNSIPEDPNLNDFGYNPAQNMQPVAEDPNLTDFSDGAVNVADFNGDAIPEVLPVQENEQAAEPATSSKKDFSKPKIFSNMIKAKQYVKENQLEDTHEIIKLEDGRVQVQLKAEPAQQQANKDDSGRELSNAEQITGIFSTIGNAFASAAIGEVAEKLSQGKRVQYFKPASIEAAKKNLNYHVADNEDGSADIIGVRDDKGVWHGQAPKTDEATTTPAPSNNPSFAEKFRDAHLNNPSIKPRLINDEIDNGRSRPDVLKEASEIVKSVNDSKPKEPEQEAETTVQKINSINDKYNQAIDERQAALEQGFFDKAKEIEKQLNEWKDELSDLSKKAIVEQQKSIKLAQDNKKKEEADKLAKKPIGSRMRPTEYPEDRGLYWEKTAQDEWTGRGDWFKKDKTISNVDMAALGGMVEVKTQSLEQPQQDQKTDENGIQENDAPDGMKSGDIGRGSDGKPFLSKNAANRGLKLRNVENTHEVVEISPSNFVLREKSKSEDDSDEATPVQPTESPFQKYDELAKQYGRSVKPDGSITKANGQDTQVKILEKKGRLHIEDAAGKLLFSGAPNPESLGKFLEDYWYDQKNPAVKAKEPTAKPPEQKKEAPTQQLNSDSSGFSTEGFDFESLSTSQKNAHLKRAVKKAANSLKSNGFMSDTSGDGIILITKDGYSSAIIRYDMDQDNAEIAFSGKQIRVAPLTFSDIQQYGLELQVKVRLDKIVEDHFFKTESNKKAKPETKVEEDVQETKTSKVNVHEYGLAIDSKGDVIDFDSKEAAEQFILDNELGDKFHPGKMGDKYELHTDQYNAYERYKSNDPKINGKFDVKNLPKPDIGRASDNAPFSNESSANLALKKKGLEDSYAVVRLAPSQFVLRDKSQIQDTSTPIDLSDPVKLVESIIADGRKVFDSGEQIKQGHEVTFTYKEKAAYGYARLGIDLQKNDINEIITKLDHRIVMSDPYFSGGSKNLSSNHSFKYKYGLRNSGVKKLVISPMKNGDIKITATVDSDSKKMTRLKLVEDKPETKTTPAPAEPVTDSLEFPLDKVKEAYGHAHLSPGNTARAFKESFDKFIQSEINEAKPLATTEAQQVALDEAVIWVKDNYINKALPPLLNAASATVSSARAGRNNFNSKQANQRGSALDRATTQFDAELERLKGYAQLKVLAARTPEQKQADADAEIKIQEEKAAAEQEKVEAKLKAEEEAKANKKRASNEWITHPDTAEHMTMEEWKAIGKDYKGITDGVRRHMGVPVWITDEGKPKPKSESKDALKVGDTITFSEVFDYALPNEPYTIVTSTKAKLTLQTESGSQFSFNPKILEIEKAKNPDLYKTDTAKVEPEQPAAEPQASDYETAQKQFDSVVQRLNEGEEGITIEEVQQAYKALMDNHDSVVAELSKMTKAQLLGTMHPYYASMYKSHKKDDLVDKLVSNTFRKMDFLDSGVIQISYGDKRTMPERVRDKIQAATQEDLNKFLVSQREEMAQAAKDEEAAKAGMNDPKIMDDFKRIYANGDFDNFKDFYRSLTLPQQALYDELKSGEANEKRMQEIERNKAYREASNPSHAVESTTDATLYAGKHTKKNTDIWTVALNGRVDGDAFNEYRSQAKSLGGYYSRYTGGGAVAGFIFEDEAKANEFLNLVTGDNEAKLTDPEPEAVAVSVDPEAEVEVIETDVQRRAEKLREKAQVIIDRGEQNINRDRKTNTSKRAGDAARAEEQANKSIFLGETLNRIADGIENGSVKYLSRLGAMTQLAHLESLLQRASYDQQRETNAKEREITANTISYTEFPQYKTWIDSFNNIRGDLKSANPRLAEKLEKTIGIRYHNAYARWLNETNEYGTENYVGQLARKADGTPAVFKTNIKQAETLVKTANKKAEKESFEVFKIKNGEYAVISSYTTAMENESWKPTNSDKQMTLTNDFGNELYNALKQHKRKNPSYHMNWLIESMYDSVSRMEKLGIHDPATFRAAMREYLNLRSKEKASDPIKEMERSMIGRSNDGLDFFPTPRNVVEQMIELADLDGDMKVLEPSAGMGHIADVLKDYGIKPDVIELSGKRQELLKLKGYSVVGNDFLTFDPKNRAPNYGDVFKTADGKYQGVMRGSGGLGSNRVRLMNEDGQMITYFDREELELVKMNGINYDRIIMNPPFSDRRDAEHIYHAFDLLADDGVMVAIAGEGVFFGKDKAAQGFQEWLDKVGAEVTPLDAGTFNDPSLPVTTGVKARIIKINKADSKGKQFSRSEDLTQAPAHAKDTQTGSTPAQVRTELVNRFGEDVISQLEQKGILAIVESHSEQVVEGFAENGKVTLVADAITPENIVPVFLHELGGHVGMQGVLKPSAYDNLMSDFDRLVKAGNPDALEAKRLAERETDKEIQKDEYLPYLITVTAKNQQKQSAAQRLVSRVLGAIKAWAVHKLGLNLKLNANDILALAERMVKTVAKNPPPTPPKGKLKTDQTETEAFKKWFGDSKVIDESGKPKIVYHGTNQSFNIFNVSDVGIHAGTMDQANSRKGEKNSGEFRVMPLYMRINNPLRLKDSPSWKDPVFYLQKTGIAEHLSAPLVKKITGFYDELKGIDLKSVQGQEQALEMAMGINRRVARELKAQGYDGIVYKNTHDGTSLENKMREDDAWIVFDPEQIKSATTNNGNFDSSNPDIRYSRSSNPANTSRSKQRELLDAAAQTAFGQMSLRSAEGAKTLSNRTLNLFQTMLHKSLTDKSGDFKKTFDLVQGKINHVTFASTRSMDVAPNVLTQLEEGSDYWKEAKRVGRTLGNGLSGGKIEKAKIDKDLEKIGTLLFENTLLDNSERHTDKELRQLGFDDEQIGLYNEVREAIDTSLDTFANTTFSNIYKHLGGTNEEVLELEGLNLEIHAHYNEVLKRINALTNGKPEMADARQAAIEAIDKVFKKANDLKDEGYVPLMRFGKYFVRIYNPTTGEVAYRQHFESESERNMYYRKHANDDFPAGFEMEQGRINELQHKLFQGVSPETVALFAKESGLPIGDAEKAYIKFAVQNNHALKRLLRRQGIDGFDTDLKRVLAAFVMSNARYSANQTYNPAIDDSILNIKDPAYQEDAIRLRDYSLDTQEELAPVKNFAFVYYMGFSAMFGLVNLTQPILQTLPYLMQYSKDHGTIFKAFGKAVTTWRKGADVMEQKYKAHYERARKNGHLDPQNTWMMQGLERGKSGLGASTWQLVSHASGMFAQASETVNRRTTLFAALDVAESMGQAKLEKLGFEDAYDFAVRAIQETQGIYNKGNRPRVARGNIGSVLMMYKQFMIAYLEQMSRMQKSGLYGGEDDAFKKNMAKMFGFGISRSVLVMLGILMSVSGATGLPFVRDILDGIETAGGLVGKPVNTEREVQIALHDALGQTLGGAVNTALMDGFVNLNPLIDIKGRMGMGDLIPATAYFSPTTSDYMKSAELANIAGPIGGLIEKVKESVALAQVGAYGQAGVQLLPKAVTSMGQGAIAATTGDYRNMKTGVKTNDATVLDGIIKTLDAQPAGIAKEGRIRGLEMKDKAAKTAVNARWKERYEAALDSGERASISAVKQEIKEYNQENPRYPITFNKKTTETNYNKSNQKWQDKRKDAKGLEWMDRYNPYLNEEE